MYYKKMESMNIKRYLVILFISFSLLGKGYKFEYYFKSGERIIYLINEIQQVSSLKSKYQDTMKMSITMIDSVLFASSDSVVIMSRIKDVSGSVVLNKKKMDIPNKDKLIGTKILKTIVNGKIVKTRSINTNSKQTNPGTIYFPLPQEPISVGDTWIDEDKEQSSRFELESVKKGIASISFIVTPKGNTEGKIYGNIFFNISKGKIINESLKSELFVKSRWRKVFHITGSANIERVQ